MLNAIKKIQSRLKYNGIIKTRQQIREVYLVILGEKDNPTEQEICAIVAKLSENTNHQITKNMKDNELITSEIKSTSELTTIEPVTTITTENTKANALVFVDPFSKALAIKTAVTQNQITLTDAEIFDVSNSLPNMFDDNTDLLKAVVNFINEKFDIKALQTRLVIDETLEELQNKQDQLELEIKMKMLKTFETMKESSRRSNESGQKLLNALKESYKLSDSKRGVN